MTTHDQFIFIYMPTHFYADENERSSKLQILTNYTVQHPKEIIAVEMNKKEKKEIRILVMTNTKGCSSEQPFVLKKSIYCFTNFTDLVSLPSLTCSK